VSLVVQEIIVALLVVSCALFAIWRLATVRLKLRMLDALGKMPLVGGSAWLQQLTLRTRARETAACGGCSQAGRLAGAREIRKNL
jgi:hypothetical protein